MVPEANVLRFPPADEKITCHLRFPVVSEIVGGYEDVSEGLSHAASAMQYVAERFDDLSTVFEECFEATYQTGTHFVDGALVFIFEVPRRYRASLLKMGFEEGGVDV